MARPKRGAQHARATRERFRMDEVLATIVRVERQSRQAISEEDR